MGTITGEPKQGLIYLHQSTTKDFRETLSKTQHKTADTFLNELIDLFLLQDEQSKPLQVNLDLAFRFFALLSGTKFANCNDLMKHLLVLHSKSLEKHVTNTQTIPNERSSNRKRKSQPRRNIKPIYEDVDGDLILESVADDTWKEKAGGSDMKQHVDTNSSTSSPFLDLSVVKEEHPEEMGGEAVNNKETDPSQRGMSLPLQKITPTPAAHQLDTLFLRKKESQLRMLQVRKENTESKLKTNKPKMMPYQPSQTGGEPVFSAPHRYSIMNQISAVDKKPTEPNKEDEDDNYNYVLNSIDSPNIENGPTNSLPASPMHVPVKYPKSSPYEVSDEENEPQDLSYINEQPQNLSVTKIESNKAKNEHMIKYDKNGNALPELLPLTSPQGQRFPTPSNLIFNDLPSINKGMMGPLQLTNSDSKPPNNVKVLSNGLISPNNIVTSPQDGRKLPDLQPGNKSVAMQPVGPVQFQVMVPPNQQYPPPLIMTNQLMTQPNNFPHGMQLLMAVGQQGQIPPAQLNAQLDQNDENSINDPANSEYPKKRKKMEDTTCFRDPPETSLPFNGPNKYRFYCDVCDTGFTRRYTFNRHKCKGKVEKHYCQLCDKAYLSKYKLKDHILVKHEGQTVSCPDCGKKFSSRSSMEMHKKQQHEGQFSIWCKICGKGFNHTGHYYGHMNKHTNTKPFWCQKCGKRFYGSSYLHNHKQVCRGVNDATYNCTLCDRKFKCELYLKKHMKIHESNPIVTDPDSASNVDNMNGPVELTLTKSMDESSMQQAADVGPLVRTGGTVFPNGPESHDSNSSSGMLVIDEAHKMSEDSNGNIDSGTMIVAGSS